VEHQERRDHRLEAIVGKVVETARRYRCRKVYGDRLARAWVAQAFARHGIKYEADQHVRKPGEPEWRYLDKSQAYLESESLWSQGRIEILNDERQRRELIQLERRPGTGGRATVDHPRGDRYHDDYANVLCLAAAIASQQEPRKKMFEGYSEISWQQPTPTTVGAGGAREEIRMEMGSGGGMVRVVYREVAGGRMVRDRIAGPA
jgi:hypothetical protein